MYTDIFSCVENELIMMNFFKNGLICTFFSVTALIMRKEVQMGMSPRVEFPIIPLKIDDFTT